MRGYGGARRAASPTAPTAAAASAAAGVFHQIERLRWRAELVEIRHALLVDEKETLAEGRVVEHVEFHRLAAHQVDKLDLERVAQEVRHARRREAHEVAGPDLVRLPVDVGDGASGQGVEPFLL